MPKSDNDAKPFRQLFQLFGLSFKETSSENMQAEECPFCGNGKFYLNAKTGTYKCHSENSCGQSGNAFTFIRWVHRTCLEKTTDEDYHRLKALRDLPLQTLKRHEIAWSGHQGCWLLPSKSEKGEVLNLLRYFEQDGKKLALPGLPLVLYGLDKISQDSKTLLVMEGAWDAIAVDQHLVAHKSRDRYDLMAVPSANVFRLDWLKYFRGREVRLCFDNDKAGREGQDRITKMVRDNKTECKLLSLQWPEGTPDKYDMSDLVRAGHNVIAFTREHCVKVAAERRITFVAANTVKEEPVEWMADLHIPFATFVSLSGYMGTQKSTIARYLAACGTAGLPMFHCQTAVPPFNVLYFTSEDSASRVRDIVRVHGGDLNRLDIHDIATGDGEPLDILECLDAMEAEINTRHARLVVLDALNSFVGGDISTDSKARRTLSGRLQALARRTGACVIGIRNWGRMDGGTASQKALGAVSLSDVARCVMNTQEMPRDKKTNAPPSYLLEFEKVTDAPPLAPLIYCVENLSKSAADSHLRKIVWMPPTPSASAVEQWVSQQFGAQQTD